jgi:hypothetical protein
MADRIDDNRAAIPDPVNVRSRRYCIARTLGSCFRCGGKTSVVALVLPPSHETLSLVDGERDGPDVECWDTAASAAFLFYIEYLPEEVRQRVQAVARAYRRTPSAVTQGSYWANCCEHCDAPLEDHELFCEPEGAFMPASAAGAAAIALMRIEEPFEASAAGYACDPQFLEFMIRT